MRVALCIGHSRRISHGVTPDGQTASTNDGGAIAADGSTNEWSFWRGVAYKTKAAIEPCRHDVRVYDVYGGRSYTEAMTDVAKQVEGADLALELHFNAYNGAASGREAFYWHSSTAGEDYARRLLDVQGRYLEGEGVSFPMRGAKPGTRDTRGGQFLRKTRPIALLWEPFFGDSEEEWGFYSQNERVLVDILAESFDEWEPYIL